MPNGPIVGYYVHHHGSGHAHRALAISRRTPLSLTGLSTAARPAGWDGEWVELPDDAGADGSLDPQAYGRLHYVPTGHDGLRARMAVISAWIERVRPALVVVDVSVEVALLARLHGVPVVTMALPGRRDDPAHQLGYDVSTAVFAPWPAAAGRLMEGPAAAGRLMEGPAAGVPPLVHPPLVHLGAISRFAPVRHPAPPAAEVVVLNGTGGDGPTADAVRRAAVATPDWQWRHLDRDQGLWVEDPWTLLCSAAVVITHAGQNAIAEIAAARRPAIVIPQPRPFEEQLTMGRILTDLGLPVLVRSAWPSPAEWPGLLAAATSLDGRGWAVWNDGHGAERAAAALTDLVGPARKAVDIEAVPA